jgi:hypothetical protein
VDAFNKGIIECLDNKNVEMMKWISERNFLLRPPIRSWQTSRLGADKEQIRCPKRRVEPGTNVGLPFPA